MRSHETLATRPPIAATCHQPRSINQIMMPPSYSELSTHEQDKNEQPPDAPPKYDDPPPYTCSTLCQGPDARANVLLRRHHRFRTTLWTMSILTIVLSVAAVCVTVVTWRMHVATLKHADGINSQHPMDHEVFISSHVVALRVLNIAGGPADFGRLSRDPIYKTSVTAAIQGEVLLAFTHTPQFSDSVLNSKVIELAEGSIIAAVQVDFQNSGQTLSNSEVLSAFEFGTDIAEQMGTSKIDIDKDFTAVEGVEEFNRQEGGVLRYKQNADSSTDSFTVSGNDSDEPLTIACSPGEFIHIWAAKFTDEQQYFFKWFDPLDVVKDGCEGRRVCSLYVKTLLSYQPQSIPDLQITLSCFSHRYEECLLPCLHGGLCERSKCLCAPGYTGSACEYVIPGGPCTRYPCYNGGTCEGYMMAVCRCAPGFFGLQCEIDMNK